MDDSRARLRRSLLFVPGDRPNMLAKAGALPADVLLLDLEDGVASAAKDTARQAVAGFLQTRQLGGAPEVLVRVHALDHPRLPDDLEALIGLGLDGLCLPKVESAAALAAFDRQLAVREATCNLPGGSLSLLAIVESAAGVLACASIAAASPRLVGLMFGAEDFTRDLGLPTQRGGDGSELLYARSAVVLAAAAARVAAIDAVWPNVRDGAGLQREAELARRLGFSGKAVIHPAQIAPVNRTFSPTEEELRYAREVIATFETAEAQGHGAAALEGQLVDAPVVERARRLLRRGETARTAESHTSESPGARA